MRRIGYGSIFMLMFCILFAGCASFKPVDLNPQIRSGQLVQKADNFVVLFDKSASMGEPYLNRERIRQDREKSFSHLSAEYGATINPPYRIHRAKEVTKDMIATIPEIRLNAGFRTFWGKETVLLYGMKPLVKEDYRSAINSIDNAYGKSPLDKAIMAAGDDLRGAAGNSAMIIVSDFSAIPGIDDIRPEAVMEAITKVNAEYGDKLCVYAIQVGYTLNGKELSEQIVQNVEGGYTVNADRLVTPAAMGAFVERVISGNCLRYKQLAAESKEKVVIVADEPMVEEKIVAAVSEKKVVVLAFEDVHFDFDKSTLKPEARAILKRDIQVLKNNPNAKVRIAGYTSASGTEVYNQALSERRALAVEEYLINEGLITRDRLSTIGYGEADPAMYEASPKELYSKAAKANMRVLFEIIVQ
jgi:outer membrane protein OmpA-like peptidoglycan-associated protein